MGVVEWPAAHLLGPLIALYKALQKPHPEITIRSLRPQGGGGGFIEFVVIVQNVGTKGAWASVQSTVGGKPVEARPTSVELLPQAPATHIRILVARPDLGDLVKEFNGETTLYGEELTVSVAEGKRRTTASWREHVYSVEENAERFEIQQRRWRQAKG